MQEAIKIIECPRDAMQGYKTIFSTEDKIDYLQKLLSVGFDVLDCASFVSSKAIPQMADSHEVLQELTINDTKLLAIVANVRGAEDAALESKISYFGYPFSISETFQIRNTNKSIDESLVILKEIQNIAKDSNKELVLYLSMGFGNPYGEEWNPKLVSDWVSKISDMGISIISLSDTVGAANTEDIESIFSEVIPKYEHIEFGAHLHSKPYEWKEKLDAAFAGGCKRFDGAIRGFGGCPMATDNLTGNMQTESIVSLFKDQLPANFNFNHFDTALRAADTLFNH
jgi:hydroxymethylglutaryl-CoA lyase